MTAERRGTSRRDVLRGVAAGTAALTLPALFGGCTVGPVLPDPAPPAPDPLADWFGIDERAALRIFSALTSRGGELADVYFQHRRASVIELRDGIVTRADTDVTQGAGMRVAAGDRTGYAFTDKRGLRDLETAAREAAAALTGGPGKPPRSFGAVPPGTLYRVELPWAEVGVDRKLPLIERVDRAARAADNGIEHVNVSWSDVDERVAIATLDGRVVGDRRPMTRLSVQVSAVRDGRREHGFASLAAREDIGWYTDERIERLARDAVGRALTRFDARPAPSGDMPVVLAAGSGGILLHEAVGHAFEADFNQQGVSPYAGRIGERIADAAVTLVDQATLPGQRGALNFDDEGSACGRNVLVENGRLAAYLYDKATARRAGVTTSGSGRRESWRFAPMPRMTCTFLENGLHEREEVLAAVDRGIVAETFTGGHVELGRGDYTFEVATGWLIEKGRITAPVSDFRLTGNGPDTLGKITMVANDLRMDEGGWTCGKHGQQVPVSQGMPTVLVASISVDGAGDSG